MSLRAVAALAFQLLRRHVRRRADARGILALDRRDPEIHDADFAGAVQHDVRRLEVAVDDASLVRGGERGAELPGHLDRAIFGRPADAAQRRREVLSVDELHRQEHASFAFADVVHTTDVRMRNLASDADFFMEPREPRRRRARAAPG